MVLKDILREELRNSLQMKKRYESELRKLPRGSLIKRKIKGKEYFYQVDRKDGKFMAVYKGRAADIPGKDVKKWQEIKEKRVKYRKAISQLKKQINFLNRALRARDAV
ncbi:MAG TPA: hypothetical protein VNN20_06525 [Thermodesulfobacteriota bacterium]|nr:hypothetical protein [Thermodesulfobacteriota bacterium]